jgi:ElaB/YqjD/DUF883 family membrane-anchored ribosome-binding protein
MGFIRAALMFLQRVRRRGGGRGGSGTGGGTRTGFRIPAKVNTRQFKDCSQAANAVNGVEVGSASSPFTSDPTSSTPRVVRNRDGTFTASTGMKWQLDTANAKSTVTRPTWPNMSAADKAAADRFVDALHAHEEGHHQVVRDVMAQAPKTIRANGATADEAVANLEAEREDQLRRAQERVNTRNAEYEAKTANGTNQAAVGGTNVFLRCP